MEHRYSLRFETGERRGETIPITSSGLSVGRKPGSSLQILDNSVSGKHAELAVDANGVSLRDLGSTNGTRVGEERVIETRLAHGDAVTFGNVRLSFADAAIGEAPALIEHTAFAPVPVAAANAGEGLERVSADVVARSKKVSPLGLVVLALLVAGGGAAWWWLEKADRAGASAARPVEAVPGNLLAASYSFEAENDGWEAGGEAPAAFQRSTEARVSGEFGLAADLAIDEWAVHRSPPVRAASGTALGVRAALRASRGAVGMVGIEFSSVTAPEGGAPAPVVAWSMSQGSDSDGPLEIAAKVPPGYDSARAVVHASAPEPGTVSVDDVVLLPQALDTSQDAVVGDHRWTALGRPMACVNLSKLERVLITNLCFDRDAPGTIRLPGAGIQVRVGEGRLTFAEPDGPSSRRSLSLRAEPALVRAGLATIGTGGYKTHGLDFEREEVTSLLLGSGRDLVRFVFAAPVAVRGRQDGNACAMSVTGKTPLGTTALQLDFKYERLQAGDLAHAARNAEKRGDLGEALKQWSDLLNGFPFEEGLVIEAEAARGRLIQQGLEDVRAVRAEVERARFFRLVDLFRQCRDKALAVGARYAGSEVQAQARALAADVEVDLSGLEADLNEGERERLTAILEVLEAQKAEGLAAEVASYLEKHLGRAGPSAPDGAAK